MKAPSCVVVARVGSRRLKFAKVEFVLRGASGAHWSRAYPFTTRLPQPPPVFDSSIPVIHLYGRYCCHGPHIRSSCLCCDLIYRRKVRQQCCRRTMALEAVLWVKSLSRSKASRDMIHCYGCSVFRQ